jgi:predicted MFS family arabinose efflux permease
MAGVLRRLFQLVWGGDVDRALRPVLAVQLAGSVAVGTAFPFLGIWAIKHLGASQGALGTTFLIGAVLAAGSGYLGGHLSDHLGRRPLILTGWGLHALFPVLFLLAGHHVLLGLALLAVLPSAGGIGGSADQAMVADLVPPERHEAGYAAIRVTSNLGVTFGPVVGGLLLLVGGWNALFVGVALLALNAAVTAWRFLPRTGAYAPESPPERNSVSVIVRDRPFLVFLVSAALSFLVYVAYESVLPISLTTSHGIAPSTWGFLMIINPVLVTLFQMRLIRWTAPYPAALKLAVGLPLMGFSFLLLSLSSSLPVIALVLVLFVIGEMLWVPSSQSIVSRLAPADVRGAYMGAFGMTSSAGWALAPFLGLQVRAAAGDTATWLMFAAFSLAAAATGALAATGAVRRPPGGERVLLDPL